MKSGFISIIGRPTTGKSTLLNSICGHQISIISSTPQTTRNKIKGIFTDKRGQIIFIDTPGFHLSKKKFNTALMSNVYSAIKETELILYVIDIQDEPGIEENEILTIISKSKINFLVIINKIDIQKTKEREIMLFLKARGIKKENIIKISAEKKINLETIKDKIYANLKEGPIYYPEKYYTDQEMTLRISEIIRGITIKRLKEELPYSLYTEIEILEERKNKLFIKTNIIVAGESQKGIIVGKGGKGIKVIGEESRKIISKIFEKKCDLFLQVKLRKNWNKNSKIIKTLIN
ncbi:GTPase Era [Borrelia miyamotoi]|uniref:GTPase Era n=1 Tax=Borrelia miyamotoi TaxID=47466 RepID=A0AAX3JLX2_9SPIR|nr:GTPase Era [Borrelia miyamotoi]QFP41711.1 GTPase Era [Borrelia miyamotoi]QFP47831.1 GTPase Era [Borrelia miyamotoi]QGT55591.1 GTPase Era [Borrelia miyamotoi]QGT56375.1 GTPase Era [Borrelia miyamotoi]WAZ71620.1 GTPase Era [Borrelia miyamotoi]